MSTIRILHNLIKTGLTDRNLPHQYPGSVRPFEDLYALRPDPWGVQSSPFAQQRYLRLLEVLSHFTPCHSILDVGCGEGVFTRYLTGLAQQVIGIDVSPTAITRARCCVPEAKFRCCSLEDFHIDQSFDIVIAIEMLYHVKSVEAALDKLKNLGKTIIVSYTSCQSHRLDPYVDRHLSLARRFYPFFESKRFGFTVAIAVTRLTLPVNKVRA